LTPSSPKPAKVSRPVLRGSIHRDRLYRILDAARERTVVWVSGPPGCGKTTLVSGYIESRRLHHAWYRVDDGDSDLATFYHYLDLAAQGKARGLNKPLTRQRPCDSQAISPPARRFFEGLFRRMRSPSVLVFDDWQNASHRSSIGESVLEAITMLPKGIRAVFVSREDPAPGFLRAVDRRRVEIIGWKELRLTQEETGEIARTQRKDPSEEMIRYLHAKTGGWATGVVLLLEKAQQDGIEPQRIGRRTPEEIVDYLGGTLFERLDPEVRVFLVKTAFLPRMTPGIAEALTGHSDAGKLLSYFNRNNFFTELHPGDEPVYEYHSLFREFLLHRAEGKLQAEEMRRVRHAAALLLEDSGQTGEAVELLRRCGDFEGLCRVIRKEAALLVSQGRSRTLVEWIHALPDGVRAADPWLLYWDAVCAIPHEPRASRDAFERAFDLFSEAGDPVGIFLSWSGAVETILCESNDFTFLDRWIDWLDRKTSEGISFPSVEIEARVSACMAGALLFRSPQHPEMRGWADRALSVSRATGDDNMYLQALIHASSIHYWMGDRSAASMSMEEIRRLSRSPKVSPFLAITGKWIKALTLLWSDAEPDAAMRIVTEGLDACRQQGITAWDHIFLAGGAYAAMLKQDEPAARGFLERMESAIPAGRHVAHCQYDYLCAWHHVLREDAIGAAAHAERALSHADAAGMVFPAILCRLAMANIACLRSEHAAAIDHLSGARELVRSTGSNIFEFMGHLTEARIAFGAGDEHGGLVALRAGMELGRKQGYVNLLWWWEPEEMARLCMKAVEARIEPAYAVELMRRRNLFPEIPPMEIEEWPWKIRIYTLGRFGVVRDGKRVTFSGKAQQKPLLLLKALIALGGRDVPREMLADALWPDADGDLALQSLSVNVRRLRKLLGDETAIQTSEGRITLSNRVCWVDCWAFKRVFAHAEKARQEGGTPGSAHSSTALLEKALVLYKGDFLEEEKERPWALSLRERLRGKFLRAVMEAGRRHEAAGEWEKALACYRKGKEADSHHEGFYRRIMICHHRLGRPGEALATYQQCRRTLKAALGTVPSPETEAVLESIRDSNAKSHGPPG
jgi:DNA-binding SARP family transcriptional activator